MYNMSVSEIFCQFYPQGLLHAYKNNISLYITEPALRNSVCLNINIYSFICLNPCHANPDTLKYFNTFYHF